MLRSQSIIAGGLIVIGLLLQACAEESTAPTTDGTDFGPKVEWNEVTDAQIVNRHGETLGTIEDLALDLSNGRIVEVLVVYDQTLGFGGKTVAVPPRALVSNASSGVYTIDMSVEVFRAAPAFDISNWTESTQIDRVTAAYHYFGQTPNFLVTAETAGRSTKSGRPVTSLGRVERMSELFKLPVENADGARLGRLGSLTLDVPNGKILNAFIHLTDPTRSKINMFRGSNTVIPPTMLIFNAERNMLMLDVAKEAYLQEPHVLIANGTDGRPSHYFEQSATGPHTDLPIAQGTSYRDISATAKIYQAIQDSNLDTAKQVEVGTLEGRVTIRGPVNNQATKDSIGAIAISVVKLDNVDNQIAVHAGQ